MKTFLACALLAILALTLHAATVTSATDDPSDPTYSQSLRYAIAHLPPAGGTIVFNIPTDQGDPTIFLLSPLDPINVPVTISGAGELGVDGTSPFVRIDGGGLAGDGLVFNKKAEVDSLVVTGFTGSGVVFKANSSVMKGCFIGVDENGSPAGNGVGVTVTGSGCTIGSGTGGLAHNVISGNLDAGILISGSGANGNKIFGNLIGTDPTGANTIGNLDGIRIANGSSGNLIGLQTDANRNSIGGNNGWGVSILGGSNNRIDDNLIGVNVLGDGSFVTIPNGVNGVGAGGGISVDASGGNTINNNVISGNSASGIQVIDGAHDTVITSNNIGVDLAGTTVYANQADGIQIGDAVSNIPVAWNNVIGGVDSDVTNINSGLGNIISGNVGNGINIVSGSNDTIQGNFIGIAADSSVAQNNLAGIQMTGTGETIGGSGAGTGNIISGNLNDGITLTNCESVTITGNIIGLDYTGQQPVPNNLNGVDIQSSVLVQVGDSFPAARNVISANGGAGVMIAGDSNIVLGNYIGATIDASNEIGNCTVSTTYAGVVIASGSQNTIGGDSAAASNLIIGNAGAGICITGNLTNNNSVLGNLIGFNLDGTADSNSANGLNGVTINGGSFNNSIGDLVGGCNLIAATGDGVFVGDSGSIQNAIRGNSILLLGAGLQIDIPDGNDLPNQPVISSIALSGTQFILSGSYSGNAADRFYVDLYHVDPNAALPTYLYLTTVEADSDASGNFAFNIPVGGDFGGQTFAIAVTDSEGDTSEFSPDLAGPKLFQFANGGNTSVAISENNGKGGNNTLRLTIVRQGDITNGDSVVFSTQDLSARAGIDYVAASGTAVFLSGYSTAQIEITVLNNNIPNGERLFQIVLSNPSTGVLGSQSTVTVSILDAQAPNGVFWVTAATPIVDKGKVASVKFVIQRSGGQSPSTYVNYATVNSTAIAGVGKDYTAVTGRATFGKTQTSGTITVPISATAPYKSKLQFTFKLTSCSTGCALVNPTSAIQTVCDLNNPYGALEFSAANFNVNESGPAATVTVTRYGGTAGTVTVPYSTSNGTALAGANYHPVSGVLVFKPLQKTGVISIPTIDDRVFTANTTFNVTLGASPTGWATTGALRTATVTLLDNDNPNGVFQFAAPSVYGLKNARTVAVKISRLGGTTGAVGVPYSFANGTARNAVNFTGKSGTLAFADGGASATLNVPLIGSLHHALEYFYIVLGSPNGGATLGLQKTVTVMLPAN